MFNVNLWIGGHSFLALASLVCWLSDRPTKEPAIVHSTVNPTNETLRPRRQFLFNRCQLQCVIYRYRAVWEYQYIIYSYKELQSLALSLLKQSCHNHHRDGNKSKMNVAFQRMCVIKCNEDWKSAVVLSITSAIYKISCESVQQRFKLIATRSNCLSHSHCTLFSSVADYCYLRIVFSSDNIERRRKGK